VDVTAYLDGVHGDTDATFCVGNVSEEARLLVERTREAMMRGVRAVAPGRPINVIGRVIEAYAKRFGYGVVRDFTGHGIGETFHSGLYVPHYDNPQLTAVMEVGMTFTIEPMITLGTHHYDTWPDGWTVVTKDRRRTAQFEHTLVVTEERAELERHPEVEAEELAGMWIARGLPEHLAREVAAELSKNVDEALRVHAQEELGVNPAEQPSPWTAAISSFLCFSAGAL